MKVSIFALSNRVLLLITNFIKESPIPKFQYSLCRIVYCCCWRLTSVHPTLVFQYSLCRIVYCCVANLLIKFESDTFQYSLCRIVYCCVDHAFNQCGAHSVSIFALSNRVLLRCHCPDRRLWRTSFNIRSVESCTAAAGGDGSGANAEQFQYSLCRIVYCCSVLMAARSGMSVFQYSLCRIVYCCFLRRRRQPLFHIRFNIRSVESCTAASWAGRLGGAARFQYSLCRIVYCCRPGQKRNSFSNGVSIFALSNRVLLLRLINATLSASYSFNIRSVESCTAAERYRTGYADRYRFQYSLCRIVYCCKPRARDCFKYHCSKFQYSLCRIVYCCVAKKVTEQPAEQVSIFALSNRVLLPSSNTACTLRVDCFNIRSVESCTAASCISAKTSVKTTFQYSLCRIVYCCFALLCHIRVKSGGFNIRSVESCTAAGQY